MRSKHSSSFLILGTLHLGAGGCPGEPQPLFREVFGGSNKNQAQPGMFQAPPPLSLTLLHAEFLVVAVVYESLTRDELNVQHASFVCQFGFRKAINKGMTLEQSRPHSREVASLPHEFSAQVR